jgi:hypothetical protein
MTHGIFFTLIVSNATTLKAVKMVYAKQRSGYVKLGRKLKMERNKNRPKRLFMPTFLSGGFSLQINRFVCFSARLQNTKKYQSHQILSLAKYTDLYSMLNPDDSLPVQVSVNLTSRP